MAQQKMAELDIDLAQLREIKRLINRAVKKLKLYERLTMKRRKLLREEWRDRHHRRREKRAESNEPGITPPQE